VDVRLDEVVLHALEKEPERRYQQASQVKTAVQAITADSLAQGVTGGRAVYEKEGIKTNAVGAAEPPRSGSRAWKITALAILALVVLNCIIAVIALRPTASGPRPPRPQAASTPVQVVAVHAYKGDLGIHLSAIGTVESSNTVLFAIPSTYVQTVVKKFDAGESLPIEAYDREFKEQFGHGSLLAVDNRLDTATGTLTCKARLLPDAGNLMIPGLFLNIRMLLEVKHGLIIVPAAAVQYDTEGPLVWVIRPDQTVGRRHVTVSVQEAQTAGIQAGLSSEELVAISGFSRLQEGRKVTYELAPAVEQRATTLAATPAALAEPPTLRFLAWQDEWQTNQPGAARHPDGSAVTDPSELGWLGQVRPSRLNLGRRQLPPGTRFLHLWFSYPAAEHLEINGISWLDGAGKPMQLGAHPPWGLQPHDPNDRNGNLGWFTATMSPGEGTNLPSRMTVRLGYAAGPLEHTEDLVVTPNHAVSMSLEGGSRLSGFGQDVDGNAFLAITVDVESMRGRRFDVIAAAKDGREMPSKRGLRFPLARYSGRFEFTLPLAEVARFRIGTRPAHTNEWRDVVLPKN
jgi:hypothetical protein